MRGRKPALHVIDGGGRPMAQARCPAPPAWLAAHARAEWRRVAPALHGRRLMTKDTIAALESYCLAFGTVRELEKILQADGLVIKGEDGSRSAHPAFRMQTAALREARLLAAELGLTPHRKPKGHVPAKGKEAWDEDLLA